MSPPSLRGAPLLRGRGRRAPRQPIIGLANDRHARRWRAGKPRVVEVAHHLLDEDELPESLAQVRDVLGERCGDDITVSTPELARPHRALQLGAQHAGRLLGDPYADQMNAIRKYVASRTLTQDDMSWNSTLLSPGDAVGDVAALRDRTVATWSYGAAPAS